MRWLKDLLAGRPKPEVVLPPDDHTQNQEILERKGLKQISYDQVVKFVPRAATEDILLSDKPDVLPGDATIHTFFGV